MATSKGKRGTAADDNTSTSDQADGSQATRSRNNRTGSKATGDGASTQRRKNEPGHYQTRDEDTDNGTVNEKRLSANADTRSMESQFDDEDMVDDSVNSYDPDDADGDIDWDDDRKA